MANINGLSPTSIYPDSKYKRKNKKRNKNKLTGDASTARRKTLPADSMSTFRKHRIGLDKADIVPHEKPAVKKLKPDLVQSPSRASPAIDSVGPSRLDESPGQAEERLERMRMAVRTLLQCVGEDPDREGLLGTPLRYAKALLFLTKGYQANMDDIVNQALYDEGHHEIVIVKNIEIHSLCEHHLVPFIGKLCLTEIHD